MSIERVLRESGGVASTAMLRRAVGADAVERAARAGRIVRLRRGWYAHADADPQIVAAVRAGGGVTCVSALARLGVWVPSGLGLHVAVPRGSRPRPGAAVRHPSAHPAIIASPRDALAAALDCLDHESAVVVLDSSRNLGLVGDPGSLARSARARRVVDWHDARAESGLESIVRVRLRARGIRVRPQVAIPAVGRVDLLVGDRLVIETDGERWHGTPGALRRDRARDRALVTAGFLVLRIGYAEILDNWAPVEAQILSLVRADRHRVRGTPRGTLR